MIFWVEVLAKTGLSMNTKKRRNSGMAVNLGCVHA